MSLKLSSTKNNSLRGKSESGRSTARDQSPSVSDIRKVFQSQMASQELKDKNDKTRGRSTSVTKEGPSASTRAARKASASDKPNNCENEGEPNKQVKHDKSVKAAPSPTTNKDCNQKVMVEELNGDAEGNASHEQIKQTSLNSCENSESEEQLENNKDQSTTEKTSIATQTEGDPVQQHLLKEVASLKDEVKKLNSTVYHPNTGVEDLLGKTVARVDDIYSDIHGAVDGLKVQMATTKLVTSELSAKIQALEENNAKLVQLMNDSKRLVQDITIMQGILQKHNQKHDITSGKLLDLTKRGMEQNLILHGTEDPEEVIENESQTAKCKRAVLLFFHELLQCDEIAVDDIWKAHRLGPQKRDKMRPMAIKVSYRAKEFIMENVSKLKGKRNSKEQAYFVSEQIPEGVVENRKQLSQRLKLLRESNEKKPIDERQNIRINNDKITIDDVLYEEEVMVPKPIDLFLQPKEQEIVNQLKSQMVETESVTILNSSFVGLAVRVDSVQNVNRAYKAVAQRFSAMDHIMMAYSLKQNQVIKRGKCDDEEYGSGSRLLSLLVEAKARNTAIFVVRQYGGLHMGFNRFKTIESVASEALKMMDN